LFSAFEAAMRLESIEALEGVFHVLFSADMLIVSSPKRHQTAIRKVIGTGVESISSGEATMLTIHERVLNELYFDVAIPRDRLKVKFQNDWVILSGEVDWPYQRSCAEVDARRVPGVTGVTNEISVHPSALPSHA
jgi:osmotically-inducible protein OsmY